MADSTNEKGTDSRMHAELALTVVELEYAVLNLKVKLARRRRRKCDGIASESDCLASDASASASTAAAADSASTLRDRRLRSLQSPAELVVDLGASLSSAAQHSLSDTAFFSPSCHNWKHCDLLTSTAWTPFASPRRSCTSAGKGEPAKWPVLQTTDVNRR